MNPLKVLSKLFKKHPNNAVVSELYSKMSQPLFVHPELGEAVMRSYLHATEQNYGFLQGDTERDGSGHVVRSNNVAVIDIAGALTAREENVPCAASPASYEVIKQDMAMLLEDESITTIVGRFDSPGGMAAQNMDLSDFIYASRGQGTKMIAMVDDMAYSAAFGIASAFDEIWVTRTSGVGSVGVVSYHVDQSEANAKAGIKIEYIYAGDKKILGNPHEELSEEGRKGYQAEVDRLYNLFTSTISRNLNLSVEQVKATQAGTFHGEEALKVGFAHKVGTFDELLTSLMAAQIEKDKAIMAEKDHQVTIVADESEKPTIEQALETAEKNAESFDEAARVEDLPDRDGENSDPKQEQDLGVPNPEDLPDNDGAEASEEINPEEQSEDKPTKDDDGLTAQDEAKLELEAAKLKLQEETNAEIMALCEAANVKNLARVFIGANMAIDQVREELLSLTATNANGIVNSTSVTLTNDTDIISKSWADAFDKV